MPDQNDRPAMPRERLWNRFFIIIVLCNLCYSFSMMMTNGIIAKYTTTLFGSAAYAGYINAAWAVVAIFVRVIAGDLCDRRGRLKVMLIGSVIYAVSMFLFGVFPYLAALILLRAFQGVGFATSNTALTASSADVLPSDRLTEGIGYMGLCYSLATAVGVTIALKLIIGDDYSRVFYVASSLIVLSIFIVAVFLRYENKPYYLNKIEEQKNRSAAADLSAYSGIKRYVEIRAVPCALVQFFSGAAFSAVSFYVVIYAESKDIMNSATFFTTMAIGTVVARLFLGRLADKLGVRVIAGGAIALQIIALAILIFVTDSTIFLVIGFLIGMSNGSIGPVLQSAAIKLSPVNRRGAASGTYNIASDTSQGFGSMIWGVVIDGFGFVTAFAWCIGFCGISAALLFFFFSKRRLERLAAQNV